MNFTWPIGTNRAQHKGFAPRVHFSSFLRKPRGPLEAWKAAGAFLPAGLFLRVVGGSRGLGAPKPIPGAPFSAELPLWNRLLEKVVETESRDRANLGLPRQKACHRILSKIVGSKSPTIWPVMKDQLRANKKKRCPRLPMSAGTPARGKKNDFCRLVRSSHGRLISGQKRHPGPEKRFLSARTFLAGAFFLPKKVPRA